MKAADLTKHEHRWFLWITLASLAAFTAIATDLYLPAFPQVAESLGVATQDVQLTLSSFFAGMAVGQFIWGPVSDRHGRKLAVYIGLVIFILASVLCMFAPNLGFLVVARFIQAFGGSVTMLSSRAIVRDVYTGSDMARTMSAVMSIFMIAPILAPSLGAIILQFGSWHWTFAALAIFGVIAGLNFLRMPETLLPENRVRHSFSEIFSNYALILKNREFRFATMQTASASFMLFSYIALIPAVVMESLGLSPEVFGLVFGANAIGLILGSQVNIRILRVISVRRALKWLVITQVSGAMALLVFANLFPNIWVIVPILMVTVGVGSSIAGNSATLALAPFQAGAAQASGMVGIIQSLAAASVAAVLSVIPGEPLLKMTLSMATVAVLAITVLFIRERGTGLQNFSA